MATEQKKAEASSNNETRRWPVSLLGCLQSTSSVNQLPWPWLMFQACFCPASLLGSNETLFQGEEPADVCCLQPYSFCGPTCRGLNAELCGLGNEGLKLCAHTCVLQLLCSCMCLGLPYVAWVAALQRQRVMTKHGVAGTDEDALATACYPCSLLQMHALLQQQHQQQQQSLLHSRHHTQQQPASVSLRAPRVQQMTAGACDAPSRASSYAGPLTSAMTTSKVMRAVRDHSTRSEGTAPLAGLGGSMRQGARDSQASEGSSDASETGVVNSPMLDKQQRPSDAQELGSESSRSRGDLSARHHHSSSRRTSARTSSDGTGPSQYKQHPPQPSSGSYLRPPPPAAQQQPQQQQQQQQQQLGPLMSARGNNSSSGGAAHGSQHHMLPPRPGMARHSRTVSLGSETAADAAAAGGRFSRTGMPGPESELITPEPFSSSIVRSNKRKLPGRAGAASQSCQLPSGFHSSSRLQGLQESVPSTPPQASSSGFGAAGTPFSGDGSALEPPGSSAAPLQPGMLSTSIPAGFGTNGKVTIGGSCSRLVAFSQEDVPLSAFKPKLGEGSRRGSLGASAAEPSQGPEGWGVNDSRAGTLANSMQQQQEEQDMSTPAVSQRAGASRSSSGGSSINESQHVSQQQRHQQQQRKMGDADIEASPAGLAALVGSNPRSSYRMRPDPQYATMQSDICNFASWLGEAPAGTSNSTMQPNQQQQQQQENSRLNDQQEQQQRGRETPQPVPQRSEGDMCNLGEPVSPEACSPKQAISPASLSTTAATAGASSSGGGADADSSRAAADAVAAAAAGCSGRPAMLAAAWAYMSDICNLGVSFDTAGSTNERSGLAAVLSRLAEESSQRQAPAAAAAGEQASSDSGSSSDAVGGKVQRGAAAAAAAGSWPDTAPSPPFATLVSGGSGDTAVAAAATAAGALQQQMGARKPALGATAAQDNDEEVSSPPRRRRRGAYGGAYPGGSCSGDSSSNTPAPAAAAAAAAACEAEQGTSRTAGSGQQQAQPRAAGAAEGLDPRLLAAVTGTTCREHLTASQEELAANLARLAFANPAAARQLADVRQQQQHRRSSAGAHDQQRQQFEPFYPTVMSDICNLADPEESEQQQKQQQQLSRENSRSIPAGRLAGAAPASEAQQQQPWRAGDSAGDCYTLSRPPVPPQVAAAPGSEVQQQPQPWRAGDSTGIRAASRPPVPPAAATAAGPAGAYSKPNLPGRLVRQQHEQYNSPASRLGRAAGGSTGGKQQQQQLPGSNATAAAAAAGGTGDTAGPLRAALLLRGMRTSPGGPRQVSPAAAAAGTAGSGPTGRHLACPGDATGDLRSAGMGSGGAAAAAHLPQHLQHGQFPGEESLASFDSFYVDCDLPPHAPEPRCAAVEAANMITNNPLYTLTASENGGTADSTRFTHVLKQQLRDAGCAAAAVGSRGGDGRPELHTTTQQQQQQGGPGSARGTRGAGSMPAAAAATGGVAAIVAVFERRLSSGDHDDGAQQPDNSRSNSPAPPYAGDGAVCAAAGAGAGKKGFSKGSGRGGVDGVDAAAGAKSAGAVHASAGSLRARQLQCDSYASDTSDRD